MFLPLPSFVCAGEPDNEEARCLGTGPFLIGASRRGSADAGWLSLVGFYRFRYGAYRPEMD